ncbi:MAG: helix-turn-helix domain-containing protein [Oscillospiraceae bacterium]
MVEKYNDGWIGINEAAEYLGVTKETVRNWIKKQNGIPAQKIGKLWKLLFDKQNPKSVKTREIK